MGWQSVCGADATLCDSDVQQFVTSKTNRRVSFLVEVVAYKGMTVTVIKIDKVQERPIFLRKNFGRLKGNVVYIRRGSSTGEAALDEIADMGREESVASREAEKKLEKKEMEDRFWRDFRIFLPKLERTVFRLKGITDSDISDAIFQYRLPLDNAEDFLRQAGELDLDAELRDKLSKIVDEIRVIDEYMNLGSEKLKEWYCNTRNTMQNLYIWVLEMRKQYAQSEAK
jgi:hypothetical protein